MKEIYYTREEVAAFDTFATIFLRPDIPAKERRVYWDAFRAGVRHAYWIHQRKLKK